MNQHFLSPLQFIFVCLKLLHQFSLVWIFQSCCAFKNDPNSALHSLDSFNNFLTINVCLLTISLYCNLRLLYRKLMEQTLIFLHLQKQNLVVSSLILFLSQCFFIAVAISRLLFKSNLNSNFTFRLSCLNHMQGSFTHIAFFSTIAVIWCL